MPPATIYDAFLDKKLAEKWPPKSNHANAIRELFNGNMDSVVAATTFTSDINTATTTEQAQGGLWQIWKLIEDVCIEFPEKHEQLIGMLLAISHFPDLILPGKIEPEIKWSEMPVFSWVWVEDILNWGDEHPLTERINGIAFTAKLTSSPIIALDFCDRAGTELSDVFESGPTMPEAGQKAIGLGSGTQRMLDMGLPIALQWLTYAGEKIYSSEFNFEVYMKRPKECLWEGREGFGWERWIFWRERAIWLSGEKRLSARTRGVASNIVAVMESVERNYEETNS